jgi:predicted patatin/cPLA2 family phospholipase
VVGGEGEEAEVTFHGGHAGFFTHPAAFAQKLHEVLRASSALPLWSATNQAFHVKLG